MKKSDGLGDAGMMLWGIMLTLTAGFILTSFGNDPSGRYFLPLWMPLSIIAGGCLCLTTTAWSLALGSTSASGIIQFGRNSPMLVKDPSRFYDTV